jgi:hypothetical protein
MQDAKIYRQYAEDCRKLAETMPGQREKLLEIAAAWTKLAAKADAQTKKRG